MPVIPMSSSPAGETRDKEHEAMEDVGIQEEVQEEGPLDDVVVQHPQEVY